MSAAPHFEKSISSQCIAAYKAEALEESVPASLTCHNLEQYACELRIFSPDIENSSEVSSYCPDQSGSCVEVEKRQFSTRSILESGEDAALFKIGASYNREEIRCHHQYLYKGVAVFEGEGQRIEEALAMAVKACDRQKGAL